MRRLSAAILCMLVCLAAPARAAERDTAFGSAVAPAIPGRGHRGASLRRLRSLRDRTHRRLAARLARDRSGRPRGPCRLDLGGRGLDRVFRPADRHPRRRDARRPHRRLRTDAPRRAGSDARHLRRGHRRLCRRVLRSRSDPRTGDRVRRALRPARRDLAGDGLHRRHPRRDPAHGAHAGHRARSRRRGRAGGRPRHLLARDLGRSRRRGRARQRHRADGAGPRGAVGRKCPAARDRRFPRSPRGGSRPAHHRPEPARPAALQPRAGGAGPRGFRALRRVERSALASGHGVAQIGRLRPDRGDPGRGDLLAYRRRLYPDRQAGGRRRARVQGDERLPPARRPLRSDAPVPRRGHGHPAHAGRRGVLHRSARLRAARALHSRLRASRDRAALDVGLDRQTRLRSSASS